MMRKITFLVATLVIVAVAGTSYARITGTNPTGSSADVACFGPSGAEACVDTNGSVIPTTDNDADLGTSALEWKDGFFDGTLTTDALVTSGAATFADDVTFSSGTAPKIYTKAGFDVLSSTPGMLYVCSDCTDDGGASGPFVLVISTNGDIDAFQVVGSTVGIY